MDGNTRFAQLIHYEISDEILEKLQPACGAIAYSYLERLLLS